MISWQPSASLKNLQLRAEIFQSIRDFFSARKVLEVDTPLLCHTSVTDPFIQSIPAFFHTSSEQKPLPYYLQTSPEYAMKRLLAAGSGCIYQMTKAFRQGEIGRFHNPEFMMLEWYRLNYNHHQLMDEVDELLQITLKTSPAEKRSYAALFAEFFNLNPHQTSLDELRACANKKNLSIATTIDDCDTWLNILMTHCIEPEIGKDRPCFIYDFPASQAALARIQKTNPPIASRFEVYFKGIELANGFHELQNAAEQRARFENNLKERKKLGLNECPMDEFFLASLTHGLPDCAGVALGLDRLLMLAAEAENISDVLSFDFSRV